MVNKNENVEKLEIPMNLITVPPITRVWRESDNQQQIIKIQEAKIVELSEQYFSQSFELDMFYRFIRTMKFEDNFIEFRKGYLYGIKTLGN
ncbi:hypothetical protein [Viridibacillus arvi]|uniref:hypothetical protein n=1 Tax=Viridibacillus arvi TaxID=263475 RepID=UPI0034D01F6A